MPSSFPYRITEEQGSSVIDISSSSSTASLALSPPLESHDLGGREEKTRIRDAAVNRQV
jgi:hypothetical protein